MGVVLVVLYDIVGLVLINQFLQYVGIIVEKLPQAINKASEAVNKSDYPVDS